jgi:hypothetical protein
MFARRVPVNYTALYTLNNARQAKEIISKMPVKIEEALTPGQCGHAITVDSG